jgi:hypothetical protein
MISQVHKIILTTAFSLLLFTSKVSAAQPLLGIFPKGDKPGGFLFITLTILALLLVLAVHELGHLIAGLVQGFRFELFVVAFLGIKRTGNKIEVFLNKNIGLMGGVAATLPINPSPENRRRFAMIIAAGPVVSLLFAILAFVIFSYSTSGAGRGFWFVSGAGSIAIFLATTLPTKSGVFFTDRARFLRLISKGKPGEVEEALLMILAQNVKDGSCKNISLSSTKLIQQDKDKTTRFWGYYYEYCYFKDNEMKQECDEATKKLVLQKEAIPANFWKAFKLDVVENALTTERLVK